MKMSRPIVVGFDCSPDAARGLRWAVDLSRSQELPLRVVVARGDLYTLSSWADEWTRGLAEEWADRARKELAEMGEEEAEVVVLDGLAPEALTLESGSAEFVVVGGRGHGALTGVLQGWVSQHVSRHAQCPVVVVRAADDPESRRVVVGVDGSEHSRHALEVALHYAGMHQFALTVLYAPERWRGYGDKRPAQVAPELLAALEDREARVLGEIGRVVAKHDGVAVDVSEVPSSPAQALIHQSHDAALVVVGSRGRGAFAGMVLGSVSADVLRHAHCPVAVIR
jgi:nucleotide-binding universal stress UspA family protein